MVPSSNNLIALEWDRDEIRYLWAGQAARRLVIRAIGRVTSAELNVDEPTWEMLATEIKQRLRARNSRVVAVLARSEVEEFEATFPPAEAHELASLATNEAHKHLPNADEARLDYLEIEQAPDATRRVMIAALLPTAYSRLAAGIKQQGWKLASIQLRHVAVAGLIRRRVNLVPQSRTIAVSLNRHDAELILLEGERIILVRSIPLSTEGGREALGERLAVEIQRSLMVTARAESTDQAGSDRVVVLGTPAEQTDLCDKLAAVLKLPVESVNPIEAFAAFPKDLPGGLHHFSGLLGSLLEQPPSLTIDLQNSKCGRPKSIWLQRAILYGSAAALAVAIGIGWSWQTIAEARNANRIQKQELNKLEKQLAQLTERVAMVDQVDNWRADDINWLDELRELSLRFPERSLMQVKSMTLSSGSISPGIITMNLQARNENVIAELEQAIRDDFHQVRTNQFSQSESDEELPWQFGATILVERRERDEFAVPVLPAPGPATPSAPGNPPPMTQPNPLSDSALIPQSTSAGGTE